MPAAQLVHQSCPVVAALSGTCNHLLEQLLARRVRGSGFKIVTPPRRSDRSAGIPASWSSPAPFAPSSLNVSPMATSKPIPSTAGTLSVRFHQITACTTSFRPSSYLVAEDTRRRANSVAAVRFVQVSFSCAEIISEGVASAASSDATQTIAYRQMSSSDRDDSSTWPMSAVASRSSVTERPQDGGQRIARGNAARGCDGQAVEVGGATRDSRSASTSPGRSSPIAQ